MRFFLDTEFIADGTMLELISIGVVSETGREFYAISNEFDEAKCSEWVRKNVLPHLPERSENGPWMKRARIAYRLKYFIEKERAGQAAEFWAYFSAYDWVLFCQLFGSLTDLPDGWNAICFDLRQWAYHLADPELPAQPEEQKHDALADARHNRVLWQHLNHVATEWAKARSPR